jgi:hypothetical protein
MIKQQFDGTTYVLLFDGIFTHLGMLATQGFKAIALRSMTMKTAKTSHWNLAADADWAALFPTGGGFVKYDQVYSVALYHQVSRMPSDIRFDV